MPNTKAAKKSLRQSIKRRLRNRSQRSALRTIVKKARLSVAGTDATATETACREATKRLDQAAAKGLIHRNKAARLKSRMAKARHKKEAAPASVAK